jgi:hypothetical protein
MLPYILQVILQGSINWVDWQAHGVQPQGGRPKNGQESIISEDGFSRKQAPRDSLNLLCMFSGDTSPPEGRLAVKYHDAPSNPLHSRFSDPCPWRNTGYPTSGYSVANTALTCGTICGRISFALALPVKIACCASPMIFRASPSWLGPGSTCP